jgi:hypothetical protein
MHVDRRLLGWGLFFIIAGSLPLLTRAGTLDPALVGRWPTLWPLLLIAWGIGLVLRRTPIEWLGGALSAIVFGVMAGGALASGFGGVPGVTGCGGATGSAFAPQSGTLGPAGRFEIEFSCGSLTVSTVDGSGWSVDGTETNGRGPSIDQSGDKVQLESDRGNLFQNGTGRSTWNVVVPRAPELGLELTLNAGEGTVDLAGANLASVDLTINAGSARIDLAGAGRLGDLDATVNAGATTIELPAGGRAVNLSMNAGNLTVCVPAGAPMRVTWGGALGSNNLPAAGLVKVDDDTWTSSGFSEAAPHLEVRGRANAGSFTLDTDGTCDA